MLERTLEVEADLDRFAGERAGEARALLDEPLADEMTRGTALRFGAVLHDVGKPATRGERGGYVTFIGHDGEGAEMVGAACRRLRASRTLTTHLSALTLHHLRLGFLVHEMPLPPRRIHEYLRATDPVAADVTLLTVADRLSARGSGPFATEEAIEAHLELARGMLAAALDWRRDGPPRPLLPGDELAAELGIAGAGARRADRRARGGPVRGRGGHARGGRRLGARPARVVEARPTQTRITTTSSNDEKSASWVRTAAS